jgi:hypothetical protein
MWCRLCVVALLSLGLALTFTAHAQDKDKDKKADKDKKDKGDKDKKDKDKKDKGKEEPKTIELFDGKTLKGWKTYFNGKGDVSADEKKTWTVDDKDKVLVCKGQPWGYAITDKEYGDYKLELEWRWADKNEESKTRRNSGVLLHCVVPEKRHVWPNCFEAQLLSGNAGDLWVMGCSLEGPEKQADEKNKGRRWIRSKNVEKKLGEWNQYEITCKGDEVTICINGTEVNSATKVERTKGKIALQAEGAEVHFRNIKLTRLK